MGSCRTGTQPEPSVCLTGFPISLVPFAKIREWSCFDADTGKDSAREIREYFIPDFCSSRDRDSYQQAFQRLLRDLIAEENGKPAADDRP